jgi:hypothetical protein
MEMQESLGQLLPDRHRFVDLDFCVLGNLYVPIVARPTRLVRVMLIDVDKE